MRSAQAGEVTLDFETRGAGDPVVLIHGSVIADSYSPMLAEPSLARFHLVRYRRRGYGGSTHSPPPVSIAQQAADCMALMRHLGIDRAHIVGHSYGGVIAIQFARDFAPAAHSLSLLEPALVFKVPGAAQWSDSMRPMRDKYNVGDKQGALEHFMMVVEGSGWRQTIDVVPGAWQMALADADNFFAVEGLALLQWAFDAEQARSIRQPTLAMVGSASARPFHEAHDLTRSWFPHAESLVIPDATHMLMMVKSRQVAEGLAGFLARHPM